MRSNTKKLTFVLGNYWGQCAGGAELQAFYLVSAALLKKFETQYVFVSNGNLITHDNLTQLYPISQKKIWKKLWNVKFPYYNIVSHYLIQISPGVIYQRGLSALTGITAYYAKKNNCRLIFHIAHDRDVSRHRLPFNKPWLLPELFFMRYGIKHADTIIAQTQYQARLLKKNYGRNAIVIPNGHPVPEDTKKTDNPITVLWIANWKPIKQPEIFIDLVEELKPSTHVRFIMLGRTKGYESLVQKARQLGIEVMGEIPNGSVNELLAKGHLLVNTSKQEGFSNTFIQAWLRRVPVVSLQVDPDNVIEDRKLGYCAGNPANLVESVGKLIQDDELRNTIGFQAREYAVKHHSLDNMEKILELMVS